MKNICAECGPAGGIKDVHQYGTDKRLICQHHHRITVREKCCKCGFNSHVESRTEDGSPICHRCYRRAVNHANRIALFIFIFLKFFPGLIDKIADWPSKTDSLFEFRTRKQSRFLARTA